jgi:hypothetical protein
MNTYSKEELTFQKNIYGIMFLLYSVTYISNHAIALLSLKGIPKALFHYSGEMILIICTLTYVFSNLLSKDTNHRSSYVGFFYRVPIFFWLGCFGVALNTLLLIISMILGVSEK